MKILELLFTGINDIIQKKLKERVGGKADYKLKCPKCNADIDLAMDKCPKCYTKLGKLFVVECKECGHKNPVDAIKCERCKADIDYQLQRKTTYVCPVCNYRANYYMTRCPACNTKFL
ncbi:MAG: zinc ribbon domain-containing protein [Candidatus Micrarchaeota archaeon]|nr:zinc ribbon domain-containing protein [Candidatus Micrarchaeota archaeon]